MGTVDQMCGRDRETHRRDTRQKDRALRKKIQPRLRASQICLGNSKRQILNGVGGCQESTRSRGKAPVLNNLLKGGAGGNNEKSNCVNLLGR